jgi:hypothetical protein
MSSGYFEDLWMKAYWNLASAIPNFYSRFDKPHSSYIANALGFSDHTGISQHEGNKDLENLLEMLAGPHGPTILKMYRIQKGLKDNVS